MKSLGYKIRKIREIKGLKQDFMAEQLQVSQQSYSNIENDKTDVPFSKIEQIAHVFNMKIEDLISFDEKYIFNNYGNSYDKSFCVNIGDFTEKDREFYLKHITLLEEKINSLTDSLKKQ